MPLLQLEGQLKVLRQFESAVSRQKWLTHEPGAIRVDRFAIEMVDPRARRDTG